MQRKLRRLTSLAVITMSSLSLTMVGCSDLALAPNPITTTNGKPQAATAGTASCNCNYTVPVKTDGQYVDGTKIGVKAGGTICLQGGATYGNITFTNIVGTAAQPINIVTCNGSVLMQATGRPYGLKFIGSSFIHLSGGTGSTRNLTLEGGQNGVSIEGMSTNIELDHMEIRKQDFAGIMAKTDPTCEDKTNRGFFVMKDVILHDNYVHDTGGEGFYVGYSFWLSGKTLSCGVKYPHEVVGCKIYNNVIKNSGWESIQVGSAPQGALVYNNRIENYGAKNVSAQNNGIQFGEGANGKCYGNFIKGGHGDGIIIIGNSDNTVYDNVIINAGLDGIFCDDRVNGAGFKFLNNTIINPAQDGIKLYADQVTMNTIENNIIINAGNYSVFGYPRPKTDAYVYLLNSAVKVTMKNNYYSQDISTVKFTNPAADDYSLTSASANVLNKGLSVSGFGVTVDYANKPRLVGTATDIGAYEY
ncbi:MAG: right-handed parallel beta-helix repeat-containing protein [Bacteroidota bacterium]